jgi:hypothetical protein
VVEYVIHKPRGKLGGIQLVSDPGITAGFLDKRMLSDVIDLSMPRRFSVYDKPTGKQMVKFIKKLYFGNSGYYMSKSRCENFFNDEANFAMGNSN